MLLCEGAPPVGKQLLSARQWAGDGAGPVYVALASRHAERLGATGARLVGVVPPEAGRKRLCDSFRLIAKPLRLKVRVLAAQAPDVVAVLALGTWSIRILS